MEQNNRGEETINKTAEESSPEASALEVVLDKVYMHKLPSFGNRIFYGLGFLALTALMTLVATGLAMVAFGPTWWLTDHLGSYLRSVHDWSAQAFIAVLMLHITVVFLTSGFKKPKRIVWALGATIFCLALVQTEFGYGLRGDFQSQWRAISGADFWNGAYTGYFFNPENFNQIFGSHILIVPAIIFGLFFFHYLLEKSYGISKAYRKDLEYPVVAADHKIMFARGGILFTAILALAFIFPSPFVAPYDVTRVAKTDSMLVGQTLLKEFDRTSGTATYLDSINPYTFDTREAYVTVPYNQYIATVGGVDYLSLVSAQSSEIQKATINEASKYFENSTSVAHENVIINPLISATNVLIAMSQSGMYQAIIDQEDYNSNPTRSLRFLADTGVMDAEALRVHMATEEWGMAKEETSPELRNVPPGSWWFAPIGLLNRTVLNGDENGDRDAAIILGIFMLIFIAFPYIPFLNRLPELFHLAPFIWGKGNKKE